MQNVTLKHFLNLLKEHSFSAKDMDFNPIILSTDLVVFSKF